MTVTNTPAGDAPAPTDRPPGMRALTLRLSLPSEGISDGAVVLRTPAEDDVDGLLPAFTDPALREAGNLPAIAASGRLLPMIAADARTGETVGGGTLHHLDAERAIVEIGYWVLPHARRLRFGTRIARMLAEHAFALGVERVAAYVNVGNLASERVLERAGYTREGVVRSLPVPSGRRVDKTLFSLLPGE
jgi:RimJ/RimL family protein N-acetyltransferase